MFFKEKNMCIFKRWLILHINVSCVMFLYTKFLLQNKHLWVVSLWFFFWPMTCLSSWLISCVSFCYCGSGSISLPPLIMKIEGNCRKIKKKNKSLLYAFILLPCQTRSNLIIIMKKTCLLTTLLLSQFFFTFSFFLANSLFLDL